MRTLRALVVGYGSIARRHIDNLRASGEVRELLVFRPQGRPADAPQDLRFLPDLADAVAAKPDLAVVASPSSSHIDALLPLLEKGIPCYVEKPPVTTESDVDKLRALLGSRKTPVTLTGCNLRFLPSLQRMREALHARVIGSPVRASLQDRKSVV